MTTALSITHEGIKELPSEVLRAALSCRDKVETTKGLLGINSLNKTFQLENGEQVYVVSNEFTSRIHIVSVEGYEGKETNVEVEEKHYSFAPVADFVCGVVTGTGMEETVDVRTNPDFDPEVEGSEETKELTVYQLNGIKQTEASLERFSDKEARIKLAVKPDVAHEPLTTPDLPISQHHYIKPSMYTGYMRAVVQLLLGIGYVGPETYETKWIDEAKDNPDLRRGHIDSIDPVNPNGDPATSAFKIPKKWDEIGEQVQVKYDYRFNKSHGLTWGEDGEDEPGRICYLIEIGNGGVFAMPLPLDPVSILPQGRARYVELFPELEEIDEWGEGLIDRLGGFPTGETFPRHSGYLQDRVRAGEVLQLLDSNTMQPFYEGSFTSSVFGWVFQGNGGRADNICIKWSGDPGWRQGWHYSVVFEFEPFNKALDTPYPQHAQWVGLNEEEYLIKKAKRLTPEQFAEILGITGTDEDKVYEERIDYLKELTVTGPMSGTANLQYKKHGDLYHPGKLVPTECHVFSGQPQIKFPEPIMGGLVSFDFGIEQGAAAPEYCDSPIAVVGEAGGGIAVVNYFYRKTAPLTRTSWNTRDYCQYEGSWEEGTSSEGQRDMGHFYTSHIDLRKKVDVDSYSNRKTTGTFVGYNFWMSFCAFFAMHSTMVTKVWHSYEWESESHGGKSFKSAIAFPEGERNVYYTLEYETKYDDRTGEGVNGPSVSGTGPITRYGVIYHFVMHWTGVCKAPLPHLDPGPKVSCRMKEYKEQTTGYSCFMDAPAPDWFHYEVKPFVGNAHNYHQSEGCTGSTTYLNTGYGPSFPGPTWSKYSDPCTTIKYRVRIFGDIAFSGATLMKDELTGKREGEIEGTLRNVDFYDTPLSPWWFKPSPDNCNQWAYMFMTQSCWGNRIANYDEQVDAIRSKSYGTPEDLRSGTRATYVGYIR